MATEYDVWQCRGCSHYWYHEADTCPECSGSDIKFTHVEIEPMDDDMNDPEFDEMIEEEAERKGS